MTRVRILSVLLLLLAACTQNTGLGYRSLNVQASHADGTPVAEFASPACTTLPKLLGSRVESVYPVDEQLRVRVLATRDRAVVRFPGASAGGERVIPVESLESGFGEVVDVTSATGKSYQITLSSGCPKQ